VARRPDANGRDADPGRAAKSRARQHELARINAANAGDNWAIRWPAEDVRQK
jgi:hypothetical protein